LPAVEAVFAERRASLGVADAQLCVVFEGPIVIGNDQAMVAQAIVGTTFVFEPAEQAFFGEQAFQEGKVAFLVLHGHAALRGDRRIG